MQVYSQGKVSQLYVDLMSVARRNVSFGSIESLASHSARRDRNFFTIDGETEVTFFGKLDYRNGHMTSMRVSSWSSSAEAYLRSERPAFSYVEVSQYKDSVKGTGKDKRRTEYIDWEVDDGMLKDRMASAEKSIRSVMRNLDVGFEVVQRPVYKQVGMPYSRFDDEPVGFKC